MASWTIVSSRWVAGLSTGSRPVSAMTTMTSAITASRLTGAAISDGVSIRARTISARVELPTGIDSAYTATRTVGSTRAAMVMCRLEPIPPNAVPESRPSSATATVPTSRTDTTTNRSSGTSGSGIAPTSGSSASHHQAGREQDHRRRDQDPAAPLRPDRVLGQKLAQVPPRLPDPRPDPALRTGPHLPGHPDQQRRQSRDDDDLEHGDQRGRPGHSDTATRTASNATNE